MFRNKLKNLMQPEEKGAKGENKKNIENLVFFVIILIITIVIINIIWNGNKTTTKSQNTTNSKQLATNQNKIEEQEKGEISQGNNLEQKLEEILAKIQGVGEVKVFVNYSESSEVIAMYNENAKVSNTEETDTSGGVRKIQETDTQKDIIYQEENGEKTPITQKIIQPKVEGAIITAKGANNVNVKTSIVQAVEAVTGLAAHKIQVFEMES